MIFFGTDGIRGVAGKDLDSETIYRCGKALGYIKNHAKILVGKDGRISGDYVLHLFSSGAMSQGAEVVDAGLVSTPMLGYLVKNNNFDFGVMISASHNTFEYNGIKVFNNNGEKIDIKTEKYIESAMKKELNDCNYGRYKTAFNLKEQYIRYVKKVGADLKNMSLLIDCANGATSGYAKEIFSFLGAGVFAINTQIGGKKINNNSGILNTDLLLYNKNRYFADYAIAFDGDGDRVVIIDRYNNILTGDKILYIMANYYKISTKIKTIAGTVATNMGIEKSLNSLGINLLRSDVGDKNLIKIMNENNLILGAENSGHIILKDYLPTGDGILCASVVLGIIERFVKSGNYKNIIGEMKIYPQYTEDYIYINGDVLENDELKSILNKEQKTNNDIKIVVRKSGTEPKIRIMVEGINEEIIKNTALKIKDIIKKFDKDMKNE